MNKKRTVFVILLLIFYLISAKELTIEELYKITLKNNFNIKISLNKIKAANEKLLSSRSSLLPSLSLNSRFIRIGVIPEINIPGMEGIRFMTPNYFSSSLNLNYTLWDWGIRRDQISIEDLGVKSEMVNLKIVKKNLKFQLFQLSLNLFMLEDTISIFKENIKIMQNIEKIIKKQYEKGYIPEHQLLQIQLRIKDLETNLMDFEKRKHDFLTNIKKITGINEEFRIKRFSEKIDLFHSDFEKSFEIAKKNRIELKILYLQKKILNKTKKILKKSRYPMISASIIGELKNGIMPDVEALKTNWNISLSLIYTIFNGNKTNHDIKTINYQIDSLNNSIDKMIYEIKLNLIKLFSQYQLVNKEFILSKKKIDISQKALKLTRESFNRLASNYFDVLNAQNNYLLTKSSLLNMKYALKFLILNLKYETGRNLIELSEEK